MNFPCRQGGTDFSVKGCSRLESIKIKKCLDNLERFTVTGFWNRMKETVEEELGWYQIGSLRAWYTKGLEFGIHFKGKGVVKMERLRGQVER